MFNNFDDVVANGQFVENAPEWTVGGTPPVQPTSAVSQQLPPKIPEWGKTLGNRVTTLETDVKEIKQTIPNLATKADVRQIDTQLAEVTSKLNQLLQR